MPDKHLHIISFDIPYPPNYGGVIDVFYKIRALYEAGVKIHLHCFEYHREQAPELEQFCQEVHYYTRKTGLLSALGPFPYIIYSRRSEELLKNLCRDDHPILFEGLHSCYYLSHEKLKNRLKIYRESNIEHKYYYHLFKAERNLLNKGFFFFSGIKLRLFQKNLKNAGLMLTVSKEDNDYLRSKFREARVEYLPSFHKDDEVSIIPGSGTYILYQGNLGVAENIKAAEYLVTKVFAGSGLKLVVAGLNPPVSLIRLVEKHENVTLVANPDEEKMSDLIRHAHINVMVTFQATGLKLKLLNALFTGRHCLVNGKMITGTELQGAVEIEDNPVIMQNRALELMKLSFTEDMIDGRKDILMKWHSNKENCISLMNSLTLLSSR